MKSVYVKTFGCQMNVHDSERILGLLKREGYSSVNDPGRADLIIFNTCSIRQKAEQKFYSMLGKVRHLKEKNPFVKIAVAGCIAQLEGEVMKRKMPYVDLVIGPQNLERVNDINVVDRGVFTKNNPDLEVNDFPAERDSKVRAWINIMYGCNNFCSYCIVPYTRGKERARPSKNIINEIRKLSHQGYKEVTLLGQNVNSYSEELSFPALLRSVNEIEGIERIRFVTSHPKDLGEELITAIQELDKVCEHIHLPLQSGSTRILNMMNRKYSFNQYLDKVERLRDGMPDIAITTDIIAGYPGESDKDHKATISAIEKIQFDGIFAFKYSPRPMTKAAEMPDHIDDGIKSKRLTEILELQDEITLKKNKRLEGRIESVLIDDIHPRKAISGRMRTNKIVMIHEETNLNPGDILDVVILEVRKHSLIGRIRK